MYKIEISIGDYEWSSDSVTIETSDFDKIAIIQEFIEFQKMYGWAVDYDVTDEYLEEADEAEETEIGEVVEDEDGMIWERVA
jgi:hypothetical protein